MPYIVTTTYKTDLPDGGSYSAEESHRAVATLDEAQTAADEAVIAIVGTEPEANRWMALNLPEQGGSIGPLPDGTVIEVEWLSTDELALLCGETDPDIDPYAAVGAYNAAQEG